MYWYSNGRLGMRHAGDLNHKYCNLSICAHCRLTASLVCLDSAEHDGTGEGQQLTLVATDVEGSTELWEADKTAMMAAISLHDCIMRDSLARHYGYEVATEGDSFTIAFHEPQDALAWAITAQQVVFLYAASWSSAVRLPACPMHTS